jgi:hypothetical protein
LLGEIAQQRWRHEAFWFGHGMVERGPHLVEYMPIGSHHSWYGLLLSKGWRDPSALPFPWCSRWRLHHGGDPGAQRAWRWP